MMDEIIKYIDNRIEKHKEKLKFYKKDDLRYRADKNLIMELKIVKEYIKIKKRGVK